MPEKIKSFRRYQKCTNFRNRLLMAFVSKWSALTSCLYGLVATCTQKGKTERMTQNHFIRTLPEILITE